MFSMIENAKEREADFRATLARNEIHTILSWHIGNKSIASRHLH
jgi:hypothetical protein